MSNQVEWLLELEIAEGKLAELKALIAEMVAATRADEPGALVYDWFASDDRRRCHILERYADSDAAMTHLGTFGARFADRFMSLLTPTRFQVHGPASEALRGALSPMGATFLDRLDGFERC